MTGRDMIASMIAIYGSRTTVLVYNTVDKQVDELTLKKIGHEHRFIVTGQNLQIRRTGKIFSPGNTRSLSENKGYANAVNYYMMNNYTLRYSGAMVPDIYQLFIKGEGVFSACGSKNYPAKLRMLYETAPFAFLVEAAGGMCSCGDGPLLD